MTRSSRFVLATNAAVVLVAIAALLLTRDIPSRYVPGDPGPKAFPFASAVVILGGAAIAGLVDIRQSGSQTGQTAPGRIVAVVSVATILYLVLMLAVGFVAGTPIFLIGVSRFLDRDRRHPLVMHATVAVATAVLLWVAFGRLLEVVLPVGPWGF